MSKTHDEPTLEEILASVQRIIGQGKSDPAAVAAGAEAFSDDPVPLPGEEGTEEVLELTVELVKRQPQAEVLTVRSEDPAPGKVETADGIFERSPSRSGGSIETVFDRTVSESLEPLLENHLQTNSQMMIERLKPVIREWMDENFPALLKNIVQGQIASIKRRNPSPSGSRSVPG